MFRFIRDLWNGEPVMFTSVVSVALTAGQGSLIAAGETVPLWLAVFTPVWVAVAAFYARSRVTPV